MRWLNWIVALLCAVVLAACGGGGGSAGTPTNGEGSGGGTGGGTTTPTPTITVALSSNTVTAAAPATVTATVKDATGGAIANQVVTFTTTGKLGAFSQTTALTNASGQAAVLLSPATSVTSGADTVTASVTIDAATLTASSGFQLTATDVTITGFTSDVGTGTLSAYGQTTLTVTTSGAANGSQVDISVTSACVTAGKATLSATSASTTTGTATFAYQDKGCGASFASDSLVATVTGAPTTGTALTMKVAQPAASSLAFVSASPETIYLKGSGYAETSTVIFQVVDIAGNPLPNQSVTMVATTYSGGLTLDGIASPVSKTSDSSGNVSVIVNSGTVPTPVRVRATLASGAISTSSSNLTITVGLPSQNNFSLSQGTKNIEGFDIDGTPNTYKIIASDRMGNPVPAGTTVNFVSEGSQIVGAKQIAIDVNGNATTSTTLLSSAPRPADGRITIVAYALGEESFFDANGNNVHDAGEDFQDLGDVFVSTLFSPTFVPTTDQRIPYTLSSAAAACVNATTPGLQLNVTIPSVTAFDGAPRCDGKWGQAYVRRATETVLSSSTARPLWPGAPADLTGACRTVTLTNDTGAKAAYYTVDPGAVYGLGTAASGSFGIIVADANSVRLNPMPAGTVISVAASTGITVSVAGGTPVASTTQVTASGVNYSFASGTSSGTITVTFTTPSGKGTSYPISVRQSAGAACS